MYYKAPDRFYIKMTIIFFLNLLSNQNQSSIFVVIFVFSTVKSLRKVMFHSCRKQKVKICCPVLLVQYTFLRLCLSNGFYVGKDIGPLSYANYEMNAVNRNSKISLQILSFNSSMFCRRFEYTLILKHPHRK